MLMGTHHAERLNSPATDSSNPEARFLRIHRCSSSGRSVCAISLQMPAADVALLCRTTAGRPLALSVPTGGAASALTHGRHAPLAGWQGGRETKA